MDSRDLGEEDERLRRAVVAQDRVVIREVYAARQSRAAAAAAAAATAPSLEPAAMFNEEDFTCSVCLRLLHKPCVNGCGHAFCFWCLHRSMSFVEASHCPLCRATFSQLAAPCAPLHRFLARAFPEALAAREAEVAADEAATYHAQAPRVLLVPTVDGDGGGDDPTDPASPPIATTGAADPSTRGSCDSARSPWLVEGVVDVADLACGGCGRVVTDPVVPACGHLCCRACLTRDGGNGCGGCGGDGGGSGDSADARAREQLPEVGARVTLHGLVARPDLNGALGTVLAASGGGGGDGRVGVALDGGAGTFRLKSANLTVHLQVDSRVSVMAATAARTRLSCPRCATPVVDQGSAITNGGSGSGGGSGGGSGSGPDEAASTGAARCSVLAPLLAAAAGPVAAAWDARAATRSSGSSSSAFSPPVPAVSPMSTEDFVFFGVGCDCCGTCPVVGPVFRCVDCPEAIGYDVCLGCASRGLHLREGSGRFNQAHTRRHRLEERPQVRNVLHELAVAHPTLSPAQILAWVQMQQGGGNFP